MKNSILKKLMGKYNLNNTAGKPDPYLEIGTRLNADNTLGTTSKFSAPLLEGRVGRYDRSSGLGLRGVTEALYNKDMSTYNMSAGLEGYLNKNIGNSDGSFQSSLGAGYGTGTEGSAAGGGDGKMNPYLQGNAALMYNNLNKTVRFGPQASYGTTSAPQPGLRVGFGMQKDGLGRGKVLKNLGLEGDISYDFKTGMPTAGVKLNFEDGGIKEYGEGGKISSLLFKGIKAIPTVARTLGKGAKALSLPSMMLGAGNLGEGSTVTDADGVNKYTGQQTNNMFSNLSGNNNTPPQFNSTQMAEMNNYLQGAVAPKIMQDGGVNLPGGTMTPIPGSDAVEFNGQSHDQGGIMVDENTEVEGGETMDKVVMNKGGAKDYFFSDHLKKGGMSYAQQHKNILQNGGGQTEVNMLAKMQEKAANRDPKQVAKLGGVMKYEQGGILGETFDEYVERMQAERRENEIVNEDQFNKNIARLQKREDRKPPIVEQKRRKLRNLQLFVDQGRTLTPEQQEEYDILSNDKNLNEGPLSLEAIQPKPIDVAEPNDDFVGRSKFLVEGSPYYKDAMNKEMTPPKMSDEEIELADGIENTYDAYLARTERKGTDLAMSEEDWNKKQKKEAARIARIMNPGMPTEAKIGAAAQFLPAIGAMLTKQKDPEKYKYTSGFENPIIAERVKGQVYKAPNQDEARARLASSYTGEQRFIDTSGAGAAGIANRQSLFARKLSAEGTLGAQEAKDQITAENLTRKSQEQADARNAQNALAASTTNAQMIQREADRKAAVDNANIGLKNARENEKVANRMNILTNLSQGVAGVMGDTMQYKADERVAKAQGLYGIYERDRLTKALAGQINPVTGKPFTQQEIALKASGLA